MGGYSTNEAGSSPSLRQANDSPVAVKEVRYLEIGAHGTGALSFPGEDHGRSLAEMAQRDLDAALQLLAERAQYITGANGAAIALRHTGQHDMLCRASAGPNAPELGALLSTEFGLSGESVRTRQPLRCDDAEKDARVNRQGCRELGISSVAVMPVLRDGAVLGVFELFSGKANAFDERDMSALGRLAEMVETAATMAQAAAGFRESIGMKHNEPNPLEPTGIVVGARELRSEQLTVAGEFARQALLPPEDPGSAIGDLPQISLPAASPVGRNAAVKTKMWSASSPLQSSTHLDWDHQSHVPVALRSLRKCQACGFPVSEGRSLCVECEDRNWRGELQQTALARPTAQVASAPTAMPALADLSKNLKHSGGGVAEQESANAESHQVPGIEVVRPPTASLACEEELGASAVDESRSEIDRELAPLSFLEGIERRQSWLATNKYVIGVILVIVLGIAAAVAFVH